MRAGDQQAPGITHDRHAAIRDECHTAALFQMMEQQADFFSEIPRAVAGDRGFNSVLSQKGAGGGRVFRGYEIDVAQDAQCAERDILRIADRDTDYIQCTGRHGFALESPCRISGLLTLFSRHRYNFAFVSLVSGPVALSTGTPPMAAVCFMITMVLYFVATVSFLAYLLRRSEALTKVSLGITAAGFGFHTAALVARMVASTISPPSFHEALSFFSWMLILVFLAVEFRHRIHVLGSFMVPLALVSLVSAAALPDTVPTLSPVFKTLWFHVALSMLGTVGFAVAFVAGVMYLIQDRLLKSKRFNVLYTKLPALDYLDHLNQQSIILGFPLLTLGIVTGAISAEFARGSYVSWNPEQVWALVTWLFYFVVLLGRLTVGWRAKRAAYLTVIGFGCVVLTLVGVVLKGHGALS